MQGLFAEVVAGARLAVAADDLWLADGLRLEFHGPGRGLSETCGG